MQVKKYQEGGYVSYRPIPMPPQPVPEQSAQQEVPDKNDEGLDKEVIKKMIGEGITTDVMQYAQGINSAYQRYSMLDENSKNSFYGRQLRMMMKGDLGQLNALARSKKYLDDALTSAEKNGALDEAAVTGDSVIVKDMQSGKVSKMSFGQYAKNKSRGDYHLLTNAELAQEREYNPQLLGDSGVFSVIKYATGMDKIKEEIYKILPTIGSTTIAKSTGAFGGVPGDAVDNGEILEQAAAAGAFRIKDGIVQTTNSQQIEKAKQTMWANLSPGAKATLRVRAAGMTDNPNQIDSVAASLAASLLDPHESSINKEVHDETYKRMMASGGANGLTEMGPNEFAYNGMSNKVPIGLTGPAGAKIEASGNLLSPTLFMAKDGKRTALQDATDIAKIADINNAFTVNGDKVNPHNTMITGNMYITWLPVTQGTDGNMKVDEEGAAAMAKLQKQNPHLSAQQIAQQFGAHLNLQRVVVGEATSFSDSRLGWFDKRDPNYYTPVSSDIEKDAMDVIDPKGKRLSHFFGGDNTAHSHLIIMPARDENAFRNSDNHEALAPKGVFNIDPHNANSFNSGAGGANVAQGMPYGGTTQQNFTTDYLNQ